MARKKELMELENPSMEGNIPVDAAGTEAGIFPGEEDGTPSETDGDGMDLKRKKSSGRWRKIPMAPALCMMLMGKVMLPMKHHNRNR